MSLVTGFDATTVDPSVGFENIPEGSYTAEIIASEEKETNSGTGHYLALTWQISDGQYAKRRIWSNLNLDNPSSEAVNIAKAELSAICRAIGVMKPNASEDLHLKRCRITVKHRKNKQTNQMQAVIAKFESLNGTPAPATGATPPWQKRA